MYSNININATEMMDNSQINQYHYPHSVGTPSSSSSSSSSSSDGEVTESFCARSSSLQDFWPDFRMDSTLGENARLKSPSLDNSLDFTHEYLDRILSEPDSADIWEDRNISETASVTIGELEHKGILSPLPMPFFPPDHIPELNEAHTNSSNNNSNNNNNSVMVDKSVPQQGIRNRHRTLSTSSLRPLVSTVVPSATSLEADPTRIPRRIRKKGGMQLNFDKARTRQLRCIMNKTPISVLGSLSPTGSDCVKPSTLSKSGSAVSLGGHVFSHSPQMPTTVVTPVSVPVTTSVPIPATTTSTTISTSMHPASNPIAIPVTRNTTPHINTHTHTQNQFQGDKAFKRMAHKEAEKGRRDRLNNALNELASLIPEELKATVAVPSKASTAELACVFIRKLLQETDYLG